MSAWGASRKIATRLIITGDLELTTPAHLGSGETEGSTDMPLLRDSCEDRPILTGTALAGAVRAYLLARTKGYEQAESPRGEHAPESVIELLFGGAKGDDEGDQSPLIVDDALAHPVVTEIRDGVRINPATRTAEDKFKYDGEFVPPGTCFRLRFELLIADTERQLEQRSVLATALHALEAGEIVIGARKSRGFGRCRVAAWQLMTYDLRETADLLAWLVADHNWPEHLQPQPIIGTAATILSNPITTDVRHTFNVRATFDLASPLLIRSEEPLNTGDNQPDVSHLRDGAGRPVISGTSLAGVLRARALRILRTLGLPIGQPNSLVNQLFGKDMQQYPDHPTASRLIVEEVAIAHPNYLVQNRVAIDRFTGGALDTALFAEAPQVGSAVELCLSIRNPQAAEIGLLLLVLKDLWTSDLPLGGTSSIGRGRFKGQQATLMHRMDSVTECWEIGVSGDVLTIEGNRENLETFVQALQGVIHARD